MAKDRIPDNYLVAFQCQDIGDLTPGIVVSCTENGTYDVSVPPRWCIFKTDDNLMVISPKTYNLMVDRLNYKKTEGPLLTHVIEGAYIQNDTLHPGDCVILMENSGAATVHEVCCENGEYLYRLDNINHELQCHKYRRHELIKVSVHEYCKHLKHSKCYLDYLERIYMTAKVTENIKAQQEIEDRNMEHKKNKYKVGDMVYWAYCSYNDNKLPAYVRKVVWDDQCGIWRYVMVMANGAGTGEIAEDAVKPCTDEEEFDNVVEQTSGVLDQEDSWMSWQDLVEHVKNMDINTVVCDSCGKEVDLDDSHHCLYCDLRFCDDCWGDHDCSDDEEEDDEDEYEDEEESTDPKPELTAEEAVRRWMGKR